MVEVESYPRLIEAIPSLESDFFRSPILEEEKKGIIYKCPKFLGMKYSRPPLNEAATSAVRKNDAALYGIQMALANLTRPINDYVHSKLKDLTTRIQGNEELEFAHTMRKLLSDVASSITQNRINNLYKSMELPERVPQLVEPTVKPLVENEQLDALLAAKKPTARSRRNKRSLFRPRQQTAFCTTSATAQPSHNATPNTAINDQTTQSLTDNKWVKNIVEKGFKIPFRNLIPEKPKALTKKNFISSRGISAKQLIPGKLNIFYKKKMGVISYGLPLTLYLHRYKRKMSKKASDAITKEVAALLAKNAIEQVKSLTPGFYSQLFSIPKKTEDLHPVLDLQKLNNFNNQDKGLYDLSESRGRFYAHSDTPEVQEISLEVQEKMYREYKETILQTNPTGYKIKTEKSNMTSFLKVPSDKMRDLRRGFSTSNVGCSSPWSPNAEETIRIKKQFLERSEVMGCHGDSEQSSNSKLKILETKSAKMERSIVSTRDSRNENLYRCQQHCMGNSFWIPVLFRIVASIDNISPHKRQGIISSVLRATTSQRCWSLCISLFRQHYDPSIRTEIWGSYLSQITRSLRKTVVSLYRDKYTSSDVLCTNVHQPGRRAIKANSSNGMVSSNRDIQETEQNIWPIRRGSLVPGQSISRNQRTEPLLVAMGQPLMLSPVESNTTEPTEGSTGKYNYANNYANIYKQRNANIPCPRPHVNNKNLIVNHLFRNTKDFNKPLTVDSISRIIKSITIIALKDKKGITPKARAIGATIAAKTGISTDAILTQANWSSYYMFSSYYKLSNDSYSNITESVLSELT
ncbi:hypothetical protein BB561_001651 [Smittium simulii]|uniref:Uncharacterized protein n=1 Tax=Smittium simulii TaxID=133385 RepID=A0A2T9YTR4_9FUNG|nr:hypothetical protein BB561_001651 [Smittium simulii]